MLVEGLHPGGQRQRVSEWKTMKEEEPEGGKCSAESQLCVCKGTGSEGKKSLSQGPETWMKHSSMKHRKKRASGG